MNEFIVTIDDSQLQRIIDATRQVLTEELPDLVLAILEQNTTKTYTTEETALKLKCSVPTLRRWRCDGRIVGSKVGASYIYTSKAINEAIEVGIKYTRFTY